MIRSHRALHISLDSRHASLFPAAADEQFGRYLEKMNHLTRTSVAAARLTVDVGAGIKGRSHLDSPLTRMVKLVTARSLVNCKASEFPVGKDLNKDNSGCPKELDFPEKKADHGKKWINCGPAFEGEVKKRYLEYVDGLDWENFKNHVSYFPRKHRSEDEKRLIFDKWAAHHGRKYASVELKEMRFGSFKKSLDNTDEYNSDPDMGTISCGLGNSKYDIFKAKFYPHLGDNGSTYWVKGFLIPYDSTTPKWYCALTMK